ncbi:redoxin family protein [Paenibacillus sp. LMG 31456]|uniref:Redoxin family protein n=1 Tax=Paenibacillus foliorum TaxID=2654974 RepID=A0A972GSA0_9BACL|nr:TlpA disulfide reductase family protein [Paenibacillus foliorum]NOU91830.1 redoxin family protein [Paenibacillus foliorum]
MKRNWIITGVLILLAGLAVFQAISARQEKAARPAGVGPKPGLAAPVLELPALDGQTYRVGGEREKPLLLNFWASWCGPCREEAPDLKRLYDQYSDRFDIYAVNVTVQDELADARKMVKEFDFKFPVLLDYQGQSLSVYQYRAIPTSFLIDKKGNVTEIINVVDPKHLEEKILELSK